jgi:DNA-directed RNA polymerase specialized sigma subunit
VAEEQLKKRRRKKTNKYYYFTQVHEDAIVRYAITNDRPEREKLYTVYIGPVFNEMVDKIVYTYKFTNLPNVDLLKEECKTWLTTILDKYDPSKGSKAFSYFSVITKNWFIHKVKKHSTRLRREVQYEDVAKEIEQTHLSSSNSYARDREDAEFWYFLWKEIDTWDTGILKPNEEKVLNAVKELLANCDEIEIFNKKAIYLYLRELTGLNTKQVVNNLNKLRLKYKQFKTKWNEGDI